MRSEDLPPVARLCGELGYPVDDGDLESRFHAIAGSATEGLFVAQISGQVVGWIHVGAVRTLTNAPEARVHGLVVDRNHRGRGIGRFLLRRAESWGIERGLPRVRLNSRVSRDDAHRFYEGCGYRRTKTQHVFARELLAERGVGAGAPEGREQDPVREDPADRAPSPRSQREG